MRQLALTFAVPCALLLSACTSVTPAFKDIGSRNGPCVEGGPDAVAQQFYDYQLTHPGPNSLSALRPWLSGSLYQQLANASRSNKPENAFLRNAPFTSRALNPGSDNTQTRVTVASASRIPNTDARNIPLRVEFVQGNQRWLDEVLMVREGQCWAVDDVRYLGGATTAPSGTLRHSLEHR